MAAELNGENPWRTAFKITAPCWICGREVVVEFSVILAVAQDLMFRVTCPNCIELIPSQPLIPIAITPWWGCKVDIKLTKKKEQGIKEEEK